MAQPSGKEDQIRSQRELQDKQQKKTFTRWWRTYLVQSLGTEKLSDLYEDIKPGVIGIKLMEVLSESPAPKYNTAPKSRFQMLENQQTFLKQVDSQSIKLVNIGAEDLFEGKPTLVLGLTWSLILHFEIHKFGADEQQLLKWCRAKTAGYESVAIPSWGVGFNDGKAFCALIHRHDPDAIDFAAVAQMEPVETLTRAFDLASELYQVPKLLEPQDLVGGHDFDDDDDPTTKAIATPSWATFDDRSIITYVAKLRQALRDFRVKARGKTPGLSSDLDADASELLTWINAKEEELSTGAAKAKDASFTRQEARERLVSLKEYQTEEKPPRAQQRAEMAARYAKIEARLATEEQERKEEEAEWKELGKDPDSTGAAIIAAPAITLNPAHSPSAMGARWQAMESAEALFESLVAAALDARRRALLLWQRLQRSCEPEIAWAQQAQHVIEDPAEGDSELEVLTRLVAAEQLRAELDVSVGTLAELDAMAAKLAHDVEFGPGVAELMGQLTPIRSMPASLQARVARLKEALEAQRARGAQQRRFAAALCAFGADVRRAQEMSKYPMPWEDTPQVASALVASGSAKAEALQSMDPGTMEPPAKLAQMLGAWQAAQPTLSALASGGPVAAAQVENEDEAIANAAHAGLASDDSVAAGPPAEDEAPSVDVSSAPEAATIPSSPTGGLLQNIRSSFSNFFAGDEQKRTSADSGKS